MNRTPSKQPLGDYRRRLETFSVVGPCTDLNLVGKPLRSRFPIDKVLFMAG